MISVSKQNTKIVVQKADKPGEKEPVKHLVHFYRFYPNHSNPVERIASEETKSEAPLETVLEPLANEASVPVSEAPVEESQPAKAEPVYAKPVFSLPNNQILALKKLMAKPNEKTAPFIELKIWSLEMFIIRSGMAIEDILELHVCNIDTDEGYIILQKKGGDVTKLRLHSTLIPVLEAYLARRMGHPDDYLFCNEQGGKLTLDLCKEQIQSYNERRGVTDFTIDQLRRAYI